MSNVFWLSKDDSVSFMFIFHSKQSVGKMTGRVAIAISKLSLEVVPQSNKYEVIEMEENERDSIVAHI